MHSAYSCVFRYQKKGENDAPIHAPIQVRSCGHYIADSDFYDPPQRKNFVELFWGVRGSAILQFQGQTHRLQSRSVFFYLPDDFHHIVLGTPPLEYYWLTIDGPNLPALIQQFQLKQQIYPTIPCPIHLFSQLSQQMRECTVNGEYMASIIAYQLITLAIAGAPPELPLFEKFREQLANNYSKSDLTINHIAAALKVHRTTLNRCLESVTGMSPGKYLNALRMQEAIRLTSTTNWSLKKIALEIGFTDPNYFSKAFRKYTGQSPSDMRQGLVK